MNANRPVNNLSVDLWVDLIRVAGQKEYLITSAICKQEPRCSFCQGFCSGNVKMGKIIRDILKSIKRANQTTSGQTCRMRCHFHSSLRFGLRVSYDCLFSWPTLGKKWNEFCFILFCRTMRKKAFKVSAERLETEGQNWSLVWEFPKSVVGKRPSAEGDWPGETTH